MLFVFPTSEEGRRFAASRPDARILICGVGMAEAAASLAASLVRETADGVVLAGIAGAYRHWLGVGSVVEVASERIGGLPERYATEYMAELTSDGVLPRVIGNTVCKTGCDSCGADIENMEGAAVFAVCKALSVPCCQIRAISNRVGEPFERWDIGSALENLTETLLTLKIESYE